MKSLLATFSLNSLMHKWASDPAASLSCHGPPILRSRSKRLTWILATAALMTACATRAPTASESAPNKTTTPASQTAQSRKSNTNCSNPSLGLDSSDFPCAFARDATTERSLWERIRAGLTMPDINNQLTAEKTQWYARQGDYFNRMTQRSEKYLFHIVEEVEKRNMPMEIALLPFVESAFVARATSSAKATGLWQFIPSTGRDFDLRQNSFRDDRRDVQASTTAALDYLQNLYQRFGDWHLALAAYNWGQGNVARAIARNQARGLGTSYLDLTLPKETREYVPKLQAIENIIRNPQQYGITLPAIANHPYFQVIDITKDIDVELVTELSQISIEEFRQLNPSFKKPVILAEGTPQILLPWDSADTFLKNLKTYKDGPLATWTAWQVPKAMRLSEIADLFEIDVEDLEDANQISGKRLISAGSTLLVPRDESQTDNVSAWVADSAHIHFQPERKAIQKKRFIRLAKTNAQKLKAQLKVQQQEHQQKRAAAKQGNTSTNLAKTSSTSKHKDSGSKPNEGGQSKSPTSKSKEPAKPNEGGQSKSPTSKSKEPAKPNEGGQSKSPTSKSKEPTKPKANEAKATNSQKPPVKKSPEHSSKNKVKPKG